MMKLLGLVPARSGSRGVPRKNIREFLGRPLIEWTLDAARLSRALCRTIVSTDALDIAEAAKRAGAEVPFLRPAELAGDTIGTAAVVRHTIDWLSEREGWIPDAVIVLEPTSPARLPRHIDDCAALLSRREIDSVASISRVPHHYVPEKVVHLGEDGTLTGAGGFPIRSMVHRRQDLPERFAFNGLIFGCRTALLLQDPPTIWGERVAGYVVDPAYDVDLDQPEDWIPAEARLRALLEKRA